MNDETDQTRRRRDRPDKHAPNTAKGRGAWAEGTDPAAYSGSFDDEDVDLTGDLEDEPLPEGEISEDDLLPEGEISEDDPDEPGNADIELTDENMWPDDDVADADDSLDFQPGEESVPLDIEVGAPQGGLLIEIDLEATPVDIDIEPVAVAPVVAGSRVSLDPDEDIDPFSIPPSTEPGAAPPDVPIVNPYSGEPPLAPLATALDLEMEFGPPPRTAGKGPDAGDDPHLDDDAVLVDSMDDDDEVEWLQAEARRLEAEDRLDEELSLLDQLTRLLAGDEEIAAWYEDILARVIHVYFPGKTPDSIPVLTVEAWELPDLIRDPVMGTILSRMDGITSLRDLYAALPDQDPGTIYRLLSRAKGKGLIRLDDID